MRPAKSPLTQALPGSQSSGSSILPFPQAALLEEEEEELRLAVLEEEEEELRLEEEEEL
jgi:hypothetical protein